jgi:hypothetical protein
VCKKMCTISSPRAGGRHAHTRTATYIIISVSIELKVRMSNARKMSVLHVEQHCRVSCSYGTVDDQDNWIAKVETGDEDM